MKVLVIGATGQVGRALVERLGRTSDLTATSRGGHLSDGSPCIALDVGDAAAVRAVIAAQRANVVINASAYTAVDLAEEEQERAHQINTLAPATMAEACVDCGARFVHYSTDYVFDGQSPRPYVETDATAPLGVYGATKLAGEHAVLADTRNLVLRTAWVYDLQGRNFLNTMRRLAGERDVLRVVDDQIGSPTPAWLIADVTAKLLAAESRGLFHVTSGGHTSWHGFAAAIVDELKARGSLSRVPEVQPITTSEFPTRAQRPAWSVLDVSRVQAEIGEILPDWREALAETFEHRAEL